LDIENVWDKIIKNEGEQYITKTGLPFTYTINGNFVIPDRTGYPLSKGEFIKALDYLPMDGPGKISKIVRGSAYVWAILHDNKG